MTNKRVAIVGTGANGASIGADLTRAGLDVSFIEQWPAHVDAMRADGIRVELPAETQTTAVRVHHLCEVAELREPFDIVFLSVKAYDTRWACELIKPLVADDGLVIGLQNGMTIDDVADIVGPGRTMGAVLGIASNMFTPGIVQRQTAPADTWFAIGAFDDATRGRESEVADVLRHAGTVEISDDIRAAKWMKLVVNCAEVLPSAILNLPLMEAAAIPGMRSIMDEAAREALRLAFALGIRAVPILGKRQEDLPDSEEYAVQLFDTILSSYSRPDTRVAVLHDWMKGRRGELDAFNGFIASESARIGGEAPVNAHIVDVARRVERGELSPHPSNADLLLKLSNEGSRN
jgi:2-dehydropantoate 2-reductase